MKIKHCVLFGIIFVFNIILSKVNYNILTNEEKNILINKGTEIPFSGKYNNHFIDGTYLCKQCNQPLYHSKHKFFSNCGWPSFDSEISDAILFKLDSDGERTEILCNNCNGHLGHYFVGENYTKKNVRHCVNSLSLNFIKTMENNYIKRAYYAGGCFWGVEFLFEKLEGVITATSGYMGGFIDNPSYKQVCYDKTGHLEAVEVIYDSTIVSYKALTKYFFEIHDPTQSNGQGPDIGEQYLSAIFYVNKDEEGISIELINILEENGYNIATKLLPYKTFWKDEEFHQNYYKKKSGTPYCHVHTKRF